MRKEGALFVGRERVAVDFEDAAGERLELFGRDFDDADTVAPLDYGEAPSFVFEYDAGVGAAHGAEGAAGFFGGEKARLFLEGERIGGGHEADAGGLLDEGKADGVEDGEDAVHFLGDEVGMLAGVVVEAPVVDERSVVLREVADADAEAAACTSSGMSWPPLTTRWRTRLRVMLRSGIQRKSRRMR